MSDRQMKQLLEILRLRELRLITEAEFLEGVERIFGKETASIKGG